MHAKRLRELLTALNVAAGPQDLGHNPSYRHPWLTHSEFLQDGQSYSRGKHRLRHAGTRLVVFADHEPIPTDLR